MERKRHAAASCGKRGLESFGTRSEEAGHDIDSATHAASVQRRGRGSTRADYSACLNGIPLLTIQQQFKDAPGPSPFEIRNIATIANTRDDNGNLINWEENKNFRAKRIRVWGREAPKGEGGKVDRIKEQLQFTLYTFVPEQENPGHFHPHSIELIIALDGGAFTMIRPKIDDDGWTPEANQEQATLDAGDLVLVPLAGWHRYINRSAERCKVMALQTPHPIMHTLIAETDGCFSAAERSEHVV